MKYNLITSLAQNSNEIYNKEYEYFAKEPSLTTFYYIFYYLTLIIIIIALVYLYFLIVRYLKLKIKRLKNS